MTDSTLLSEMDLPDDVVEKARLEAAKTRRGLHDFCPETGRGLSGTPLQRRRKRDQLCFAAAIRAALQAMVEMGMAKLETRHDIQMYEYTVLIIRLTSDERKQKILRQGGPEPHEREQWDPQKGRYG